MHDPRLDNLLDRYQELLDDGQCPSLDELCRECPELRPKLERLIARLHKIGNVLGEPPPPDLPPLSLSDDKTWVNQANRETGPVEIPAPPGYEVFAPLGEGGMGIVYKARQIGLNRLVALKMILAGTRARAVDLARFYAEAQAIALLRHPNIVQVYETGEYRNQPFFSLEFCPGGTLARSLNGEPQPPGAAAAMAEVLARAVDYAHTRGIVHRDLKPSNVLLSTEGGPADAESSTLEGDPTSLGKSNAALAVPHSALKITDFGLAKRVDDASDKTQDGSVIGTPSYMAPEQAFGRTKDIDRTTDIHALGAMLYEFLTGRPPFKGSSVHETLEQVRYRDPVPVRHLQPKVPSDLETICLKCLQKDGKKRYPTALALAEDLHRFRMGHTIQARPISRLGEVSRWCRREPRTAIMLATITFFALAMCALGTWSVAQRDLANNRMRNSEEARLAALESERLAREAEASLHYDSLLNEVRSARTRGRPGWTWPAREKLHLAASLPSPKHDPVVLRTELAALSAGVDLRFDRAMAENLAIGAITFAHDGRIAVAPQVIVAWFPIRYVLLIDPRTKQERRLPFVSGNSVDRSIALCFTPDGNWLFLALREGEVIRWDLRGAEPVRTKWTAHEKPGVRGLAISPDSQWVFTGGHDGQVKRWPVAGEPKLSAAWPTTGGPPGKLTSLAFSRAKRDTLLTFGTAGARAHDAATLDELPCLKQPDGKTPTISGSYGKLAHHSESGLIAVTRGGEIELTFWDREACVPIRRLHDSALEQDHAAHADTIDAIAFHPSGRLLASVSPTEGLVKIWNIATGELAFAIPSTDARVLAFSPDGRWIALSRDHQIALYDLAGFEVQTLVAGRGLPIHAMGLTAEGQLATIASRKCPDRSDHGDTLATIRDSAGRAVETVIQRTNGRIGGKERVVAFPNGKSTAFLTGDGSIVSRGADARVLQKTKPGPVRDLAFDGNGQLWTIENNQNLVVRANGGDNQARIIPVGATWAGRKDLACVRAGAKHVIVGCENGHLRLLDLDGKVLRDLPCFDQASGSVLIERATTVFTAELSPDETLAAAGTDDGRLWMFRVPSGEQVCSLPGHDGRVTTMAFDPTGQWLATGGRDAEVALWKRRDDRFELYLRLERRRAAPVRQVLFSRDGKDLYVLHEKETAIRVWHLELLKAQLQAAKID